MIRRNGEEVGVGVAHPATAGRASLPFSCRESLSSDDPPFLRKRRANRKADSEEEDKVATR